MSCSKFIGSIVLLIFQSILVHGSTILIKLDTKADFNSKFGHSNCSYAENLTDFTKDEFKLIEHNSPKNSSGFWKSPEGNFSCFISFNLSTFPKEIPYSLKLEGIETGGGKIMVSVNLSNEIIQLPSSVEMKYSVGDWIERWYNLTGLVSTRNPVLIVELHQPNENDLSILDTLTLETSTRKLSAVSSVEPEHNNEAVIAKQVKNSDQIQKLMQNPSIIFGNVGTEFIVSSQHLDILDKSASLRESAQKNQPLAAVVSKLNEDESSTTEESTNTEAPADSESTTASSVDSEASTGESSDSDTTTATSDGNGDSTTVADGSGATEESSDTSGATEESSSDTSGATEESSSDSSVATEESSSDTSGATEESSSGTSGVTEESTDGSGITVESSDSSGATEDSSGGDSTTTTKADGAETTTTGSVDDSTRRSELPDKAAQGSPDKNDDSRNRIGIYVGLISIMILIIGIALAIVIYRVKKLRQVTMVSEF